MSRQNRKSGAKGDRTNLYFEITNKIITELEAGRVPWVQPWGTAAANPDLHHMSKSLEDGSLAAHVDLDAMRRINPEIVSFQSWLAGSGRRALDQALGPPQSW